MNKVMFAGAALALFASTACTSTTKVSPVQPGDQKMSCAELENEFVKLEDVMNEADDNKGVNTANVAAVVFFWPAAVGNYMDADKAQDLVDKRRDHLMDIHTDKGCDA
ncbi:hypothetical protein [Hyphomonas sp.]|uniref:hypothetical protein n=1 Tax=Hyphomonas sp. TaxID=87 RepID=UPI000DF98F43|nr:hypothetical protein [Hyphomonas sp.]RCL86105.1 MAG: hypothetical protein DBW63_11030 [Hyphomonas sp.]|tara:strand:+ start:444 stop:767 length:324 start_codon:yes stop_codon:yes gene_type:complete